VPFATATTTYRIVINEDIQKPLLLQQLNLPQLIFAEHAQALPGPVRAAKDSPALVRTGPALAQRAKH